MKGTRRNHGAAFKAPVAFAAVKGEQTLAGVGHTLWRAFPPDHGREAAVAAAGRRRVWRDDEGHSGGARSHGPPRQDRAAGAGACLLRTRAHQSGLAERNARIDRPPPCRGGGTANSWRWRGRPRTTSRRRGRPRLSRCCAGSTCSIWPLRLPAPECCAISCGATATRSGARGCVP